MSRSSTICPACMTQSANLRTGLQMADHLPTRPFQTTNTVDPLSKKSLRCSRSTVFLNLNLNFGMFGMSFILV
jgi:hypothetical protein